jgi:hypothetical protein
MANWEKKIPNCFAGNKFAIQRTEQDGAFELLRQLRTEGIGWSLVGPAIKEHLKKNRCSHIAPVMVRVRAHFKPWLEE